MSTYSNKFLEALLSVDKQACFALLEKRFRADSSFSSIENLIIESLQKVGEGWENGTVSLSQVYMSGVICEELFDKYIAIKTPFIDTVQKIGILTLNDHHTLGKRIVTALVHSYGYNILDLGSGLSPEKAVTLIKQAQLDIIFVSTLMLHSALKIKNLKELLIKENLSVKVIVGGAPFRFDENLWQKVNAVGCCTSAFDTLKYYKEVK